MADRKKVLKAAVVAAVILVPVAAAVWYYWPKEILFYVFAEKDPYSFVVTLNGDEVISGVWAGNGNTDISTQLVRFAKKPISGSGFDVGVSVNGSPPLSRSYSIFGGGYISVYLYKEVVVLQTNAEPLNYGRPVR
jgi:hypothetical protein